MDGNDETGGEHVVIRLSGELKKEVERRSLQSGEDLTTLAERALQGYLLKQEQKNAVFLSTPVNAMMKGYYRQNTSIAEVKRHGDFGLGTLNNLDGEMVLLDGTFYQVSADGFTYPVPETARTPFACVTFFSPDTVEEIDGELDYATFNNILERLILSQNMLYAIRVDGLFSYVNVWSVSRQENYQPMADVGDSRPVFEHSEIEGTMAGFFTPRFIKSLNMPGFHLHFLTADRRQGGHVHECRLRRATIALQHVPRLILNLPITLDYLTANLPR